MVRSTSTDACAIRRPRRSWRSSTSSAARRGRDAARRTLAGRGRKRGVGEHPRRRARHRAERHDLAGHAGPAGARAAASADRRRPAAPRPASARCRCRGPPSSDAAVRGRRRLEAPRPSASDPPTGARGRSRARSRPRAVSSAGDHPRAQAGLRAHGLDDRPGSRPGPSRSSDHRHHAGGPARAGAQTRSRPRYQASSGGPTNNVAIPPNARNVPSGSACRPERPLDQHERDADDRPRNRREEHRQQHRLPAHERARASRPSSSRPGPAPPRRACGDTRVATAQKPRYPAGRGQGRVERARARRAAGSRAGRPRCRAA